MNAPDDTPEAPSDGRAANGAAADRDGADIDRADALERLGALALVRGLAPERRAALLPHVRFVRTAPGRAVFRAGTRSNTLFLIVEGELELRLPMPGAPRGVRLQRRRAGDTAGDFAVLSAAAHQVDAIAARTTLVATLPRAAFERLGNLDPGLLARVYDAAAELSRRATLVRLFTELFGTLDPARVAELLRATRLHRYAGGERVFAQGDPADGLHLVVSGRLVVERTGRGGERVRLAEVRGFEAVGELALLSGETRSASVTAARTSTVALLPRADFERIVATDAALLGSLSRLVVRRQLHGLDGPHGRRLRRHERPRDRVFALVPLDASNAGGPSLSRVTRRLRAALAELGSVLVLDAAGFDTLYGERGASRTRAASLSDAPVDEWLEDREGRHDATVLVADASDGPWTGRVVQRADRVLLLASADASPSLRRIERDLAQVFPEPRYAPRVELVLVHPPGTLQPAGTARWLDVRRVDGYHHARLDSQAHFRRLARRMAGRARGLVLSGGGARGYAHLGVQRWIEERGLDIDCIGGSSMGALLGAMMAAGADHRAVAALSARFANRRALFDYTLPIVSLMKSAKLERFCRTVYGEARAEDLWVPFFAVASNLSDGRGVVLDRGPLARIVRTTISLPGLFSPIPTATGDLLIDGAVLDNFPAARMLERLGGRGEIVGVNVGRVAERTERYRFGASLSGWRVLWSRLRGRPMAVPRVAETLLRSADVKDIARLEEARALCDVLIEPDVARWSLLDFREYAAIAEVGYLAARETAGPALESRGPDAAAARSAAANAAAAPASAPHSARGVVPATFAASGVAAGGEQQRRKLRPALTGGAVQRGVAALVGGVDAGRRGVQQDPDGPGVAVLHRAHQRGAAVRVAGVRIGPDGQQPAHRGRGPPGPPRSRARSSRWRPAHPPPRPRRARAGRRRWTRRARRTSARCRPRRWCGARRRRRPAAPARAPRRRPRPPPSARCGLRVRRDRRGPRPDRRRAAARARRCGRSRSRGATARACTGAPRCRRRTRPVRPRPAPRTGRRRGRTPRARRTGARSRSRDSRPSRRGARASPAGRRGGRRRRSRRAARGRSPPRARRPAVRTMPGRAAATARRSPLGGGSKRR